MIKSTDREVRALIEALGSDEARREAAVARLIIIGSRAMARLITTLDSTDDRETHLAILRVLEAVGDDRALPTARNALAAGGDLAVQGVSVLVQLLERGSLTVQEGALDELIVAAADERAERRVRLPPPRRSRTSPATSSRRPRARRRRRATRGRPCGRRRGRSPARRSADAACRPRRNRRSRRRCRSCTGRSNESGTRTGGVARG